MGLGKFFGINNYSTPGKGVTKEDVKNEKPLKKFFRIFFQNIIKFIELNLLFFACCIPVITSFFSYAGMSKIVRDFIWNKNPSIFSDFFSTMKKNFKQLLAITLINVLVFLVLGAAGAIYILNFLNIGPEFEILQQSGFIYEIAFVLLLLISLIFIVMNFYITQMAFTFDLTLKQIYKNALILTVAGLKKNLCALLIVAAVIVPSVFLILFGYLTAISTLLILIIPVFCNYVIEFFTLQVIQEFMIDPYNRMNNITEDDNSEDNVFSDELTNKDHPIL